MDKENGEIDVELKEPENKVDPDLTIEEVPDKKIETPVKKEAVSAEEGIKKLQGQLQKETQARIKAEYSANQHAEKANRLETEVDKSQLTTIDNAIEFAKVERGNLKKAYAAALAAGDFEAASDISEKQSDIAAKLLNLENGKVALSERPRQTQPVIVDPVEAFAKNLQAPAAAWIRQHPDYVTDTKLNRKMIAAHNLAMADDVKEGSPEYFTHVESTLGLTQKTDEPEVDAMADAAKPIQRRSSPAAAPPSRSMGSDGKKINVVTLTRDEIEMAEMSGQTKEEYARNKQKLTAEGRLGRAN